VESRLPRRRVQKATTTPKPKPNQNPSPKPVTEDTSRLNTPLQFDSGSGTANLVSGGIVDHSMPVPELTHLEATAIQVTLAGIPVIFLAPYLSPYCPPIGAELTACFGSRLPVLMLGNLNTKHVDWNSRLSTRRGKHPRDYADENSCLNFGPDSQPLTNTTPPLLLISWTT